MKFDKYSPGYRAGWELCCDGVYTQGTESEQRVHGAESMNSHLEMSVEHTAQTELDVVRLRRQTEVNWVSSVRRVTVIRHLLHDTVQYNTIKAFIIITIIMIIQGEAKQ